MAVTRLTDIVPVHQFTSLVAGALAEQSRFRQSGMVGTDPRIDAKAKQAGLEVQLREWKRPLSAEATSANDDPTSKLTPSAIQQQYLTARTLSRQEGFSAMEITDFISDGDAVDFAIKEFARLRAGDEELAISSILAGVTAANSDMVSNIALPGAGTPIAANKMSVAALIGARGLLGDFGSTLSIVAMHSDVCNNLRLLQPNAFIPLGDTNVGLHSYLGYTIVETDNLTKGTNNGNPVYTSYMVGAGVLAYADCNVDVPLEDYRDPFAGGGSGQDTIINRWRYLMHISGHSNAVAPTNGISQTNSELATAGTWTRVAPRKTVPLVAIKSNG